MCERKNCLDEVLSQSVVHGQMLLKVGIEKIIAHLLKVRIKDIG